MDRNVTKNHSVHNVVSTQFTEVLTILIITENIMVTADQDLVTVEWANFSQGVASPVQNFSWMPTDRMARHL
jgi:hypothetical protein